MRVIYYTRPCFIDTALPLIRELAKKELLELHVILELSPQGWNSSVFQPPEYLEAGVITLSIDEIQEYSPEVIHDYFTKLAGFHLAVYNHPRWHSLSNIRVALKLASRIRKINPDVIHFDDASSKSLIIPLLSRKSAKILSIHDAEAHSGEGKGRSQQIKEFFTRHSQHIIFHSDYCKNVFPVDIKDKKSSVIPLGIMDIFNRWKTHDLHAENNTILFFGRISPYKGLETLLKAAPVVARKVPSVKFIIAGNPIQDYKVPEFPSLQNGGKFETYLEYIPNSLLCQLFQRASVAAMPYTDATQSGVMMTAYAFQKPVIATCVGGLPEFIDNGKTGLLVPPEQPFALANAIISLLSEPRKIQKMSGYIKQKNQNQFSWDKISEMTIDIYNQLTRQHEESQFNFSKSQNSIPPFIKD
ncbi:glycosyltransferase [Candidatus Poribacteria bacterium]|nr:glycosyltransferase [Candidatus Poribacteria bacterium]